MSKLMTLDVLSGIKGAKASEAVSELFKVIKNARTGEERDTLPDRNISNVASLEDLRSDNVIHSS